MRSVYKKQMTALFRVDASQRFGLGHLMRSLALAEAMQEHEVEPFFILGDAEEAHVKMVEARGFLAYRLRCASGSLLDATFTRSFAQRYNAKICVLDSYRFERGYFQIVTRDGLFSIALDDLGRTLPVDLVVNPNAGAERFSYPESRIALCGLSYALLRREFLRPSPVTARAKHKHGVLLSFGGTDPTNATAKILRLLPAAPQEINVLYGGAQKEQLMEEIARAKAAGHSLNLHEGFHHMAPMMRSAERAISAAGGTLLELGFLGVPTLSFAVAENQVPGVSALALAGVVSYGGFLPNLSDDEVRAALTQLLGEAHPAQQKKVIDGRGASRVVEIALSMQAEKNLRLNVG